jgi:hypothetical protein
MFGVPGNRPRPGIAHQLAPWLTASSTCTVRPWTSASSGSGFHGYPASGLGSSPVRPFMSAASSARPRRERQDGRPRLGSATGGCSGPLPGRPPSCGVLGHPGLTLPARGLSDEARGSGRSGVAGRGRLVQRCGVFAFSWT